MQNLEWIRNHSEVQQVQLEGHCDSLGSEAYNVGLGRRRAESVKRFLTAQGISTNHLPIISYGEERPLSKRIILETAESALCHYTKTTHEGFIYYSYLFSLYGLCRPPAIPGIHIGSFSASVRTNNKVRQTRSTLLDKSFQIL